MRIPRKLKKEYKKYVLSLQYDSKSSKKCKDYFESLPFFLNRTAYFALNSLYRTFKFY